MSVPVFLLATQRSGTNFFRSVLRSTGQFRDFDEILHSAVVNDQLIAENYFDWKEFSYFRFRAAQFVDQPNLSIPTKENVNQLFDRYIKQLQKAVASNPYFLLDIKYSSLHHFDPVWHSLTAPKYLFEILGRLDCYVLHLVRKNVFNVYLSEEIARASQLYVVRKGQESVLPKIKIQPDLMLWNLGRIEREVNMVRFDLENVSRVCEITYENLASCNSDVRKGELGKLQDFFNTDLKFKFSDETNKIIKDRWAVIENVDEVKRAVSNSPYEWCLQD